MSTVAAFAALLQEQQRARYLESWPGSVPELLLVQTHEGRVYTRVDICHYGQCSGRYMVENATGIIYGIKAYGKVHKGHRYGTLDTIDQYDWSGYVGRRL